MYFDNVSMERKNAIHYAIRDSKRLPFSHHRDKQTNNLYKAVSYRFNRIHICNKHQNTVLISQGTLIQHAFCRHFKWTPEIQEKEYTPKPCIIRMAFCMISRSRFGVRSTFPSTARLEAQASRQREKQRGNKRG